MRAGVNAVLRACMKLDTLHLLQCTGPLSDAAAAGLGEVRAHVWFRDLRIVGSAAHMTDAGVKALLGRYTCLRQLGVCFCCMLGRVGPDMLSAVSKPSTSRPLFWQ